MKQKINFETKRLNLLTPMEVLQANKIISQINLSPLDKIKRKVYFLEKYYRIAYLLKRGKKLLAVAYLKQNYIFNFAVLITEQGKGYGKMLLNYILKDLIEQGYKKVQLNSNLSYLDFWEEMGFYNKNYIKLEKNLY